MTFPSPTAALDYLKSRIGDFFAQSQVLSDLEVKTIKLKKLAIASGDQAAIGRLIVAQTQTKQLLDEQYALERQIRPFSDAFGLSGLGFPLVLIPVAVGVASLLYLHFEKINNQKKALELISKGMLKPSEAKSILDSGSLGFGEMFGGGMGMILPFAALGFGMWYLFMQRPAR